MKEEVVMNLGRGNNLVLTCIIPPELDEGVDQSIGS